MSAGELDYMVTPSEGAHIFISIGNPKGHNRALIKRHCIHEVYM